MRVNFSFSRAKWGDLVQLLERHNDNIARLLEGSEERYAADSAADDKKHQYVAALQHVRASVCTIHRAVAQSWRCDCMVRHHACLLLQDHSVGQAGSGTDGPRSVPSHAQFELLFRFGSAPNWPQAKPWDMFDVKIEVVAGSPSRPVVGRQSVAGKISASSTLGKSTYASVAREYTQAEPPPRSATL